MSTIEPSIIDWVRDEISLLEQTLSDLRELTHRCEAGVTPEQAEAMAEQFEKFDRRFDYEWSTRDGERGVERGTWTNRLDYALGFLCDQLGAATDNEDVVSQPER